MRFCTAHYLTTVLLTSVSWCECCAQPPLSTGECSQFAPLRPFTDEELSQREARVLYGLGVRYQHQDRLLEALGAFEEAREQDPQAAAIHRVLIPLYGALGRTEEALASCRKALDLDPTDFQTWAVYAQQLKGRGQLKEARAALGCGLACPRLLEHADMRAQMHFELGTLCDELMDCNGAVAAFLEVVKILDSSPGSLEKEGFDHEAVQEEATNTYERIVKICIQAGQYDRALSVFTEALKKHPDLKRRLNYSLAKITYSQGRAEKALEYLDAYLATQPQGTEAHELRIAILKQLRRDGEVIPSLTRYSERDVHNIALRLLLARHLAAAGRTSEAEKVFLELATQSPSGEIYSALFTMYGHDQATGPAGVLRLFDDTIRKSVATDGLAGDPQASIQARAMLAALREDITLAKGLVAVARQLVETENGQGKLHSQTEALLAALAGKRRLLGDAEFFYRRCLANLTNRDREVALYGGLIQILWQQRKFDALVEVCRQGLEKAQPADHILLHENLSRALVHLGRADEAVAEADRAVARATPAARLEARLSRMYVLERTERFDAALAEGQALLNEFTQPGEVREIRHRLSNLYSTMGDFVRAEEQLQSILKSDPNDATANNDLGYYWADQGKNLEEAERLIRRALELDRLQKRAGGTIKEEDIEDNAAFLDSLGWVLFRQGQVDAARGCLEKAADLLDGEDDPVVWDHMGDVYFKQADRTRARAAWKKSLVLYETDGRRRADDHYKELKRKLENLEAETKDP